MLDFTAAWCVTCQVNEQTALNTGEAVKAFQRTGAVYLKADWTNRDGAIAASTRPLHRARTLVVLETEIAREDGTLVAKVTQTQIFK